MLCPLSCSQISWPVEYDACPRPVLKTILCTILAPGSVLVLVPCWTLDVLPRPESSRAHRSHKISGHRPRSTGPSPTHVHRRLRCLNLARQQHSTACDSGATPHSSAFRYNGLSSTTKNPRSAASSAIRTSDLTAPSRAGFRGSNSAPRVGTATDPRNSRPAAEAS
jgi:hypothetical protein